MTHLTENISRDYELGDENSLPVAGGAKIFAGATVGISDGFARQFEPGDRFVGFALERADATDASDGEQAIRIRHKGKIILELVGVSYTSVGRDVIATSGNSFTIVETNEPVLTDGVPAKIGRILRVDGTQAIVEFTA